MVETESRSTTKKERPIQLQHSGTSKLPQARGNQQQALVAMPDVTQVSRLRHLHATLASTDPQPGSVYLALHWHD
jgi:hypothetical protein